MEVFLQDRFDEKVAHRINDKNLVRSNVAILADIYYVRRLAIGMTCVQILCLRNLIAQPIDSTGYQRALQGSNQSKTRAHSLTESLVSIMRSPSGTNLLILFCRS